MTLSKYIKIFRYIQPARHTERLYWLQIEEDMNDRRFYYVVSTRDNIEISYVMWCYGDKINEMRDLPWQEALVFLIGKEKEYKNHEP